MMRSNREVEVNGLWYEIDRECNQATVIKSKGKSYSGDIVIPEIISFDCFNYSVTSIGNEAFKYCKNLTSVFIGNFVKSIGKYAFKGCSMLSEVNIPDSVTSIEWGAFRGCSELTSVTIPNSVRSIGNHAFKGCSGLKEILSFNTTPPTCGSNTFEGVNNAECVVKVPEESIDAYSSAAEWLKFIHIEALTEADGIEGVNADAKAQTTNGKFLENGRLFIRKAGMTYNAAGVEL